MTEEEPRAAAPAAALVTTEAPTTPARTAAPDSIRSQIERMEGEFSKALGKAITPERFTRIALTAVKENPDLARCTTTSLLGALMTAAQLGLEPNTPLGHAYLIPRQISTGPGEEQFEHRCQFQLGYKGIIDLARRSGVNVVARQAYEGDSFHIDYGSNEIVHRPTLDPETRGEVVCYYAIAEWEGGRLVHMALPADVERHRERSASRRGPWTTDYDAMARKTVVRMMAPYLPLNPQAAQAVEVDDTERSWDSDEGIVETIAIEGDDQ